jgi:hypothetical protein
MNMHTEEIRQLLRRRYAPSAYALFEEVGDATGHDGSRFADAVAISIWPSRGLDISGFEIKVSLGDWNKELADPTKADAISQYCDYWWVVAPKGVVPIETVPSTWGLMEVSKRGLHAEKIATKLEAKPLTRHFVAAMLRRTAEWAAKIANDSGQFKKGYEKGKQAAEADVKLAAISLKCLQDKVSAFHKASGVDIADCWNGAQLGDAVRSILNGRHLTRLGELRRVEIYFKSTLDSIQKEIAEPEAPKQ